MECKACTSCCKFKTLDNYYTYIYKYKDGSEVSRYRTMCKQCYKERAVKYDKEHPEKRREIQRKANSSPQKSKRIRELNQIRRENGEYRKWLRSNKDKSKHYRMYRNMHKKHEITKVEWESCKQYFNKKCAYCELSIEKHFKARLGQIKKTDFHKEHVNHEGSNDLSNCVPSCQSCNSSKHNSTLEDWYNEDNKKYTIERINKIKQWLQTDYKKFKE